MGGLRAMIRKLREFIFCGKMNNWENTDGYRWTVIVFFLLLLPVFFGRLGENTLLKSDELQYAATAKEILQTGDWFTMHYNGNPVWLKPPLYFWGEAVFFKIFGTSEYWARFPSALTGYTTLLLIYAIGVRLYGRKAGFLSVWVLATSFFFLQYSRRAMLDVPIAFSTTLGIYALLRGEANKRFDLLFGLAVALGYYFKAVQGLYIVAIAPLYLAATGQWRRIIRPSMLAAYSVSVALTAAWVWPQILVHGDNFIYSSSGIFPVLHRGYYCVDPSERTPFYLPLTTLLKIDWPWVPLSVYGFALLVRRGIREKGALLVLIWTGVVLSALMASSNVFDRYLITVIPPLALCAGIALARWIKDEQLCTFSRAITALLVFVVLLAVCFPVPLDRRGYEQIDLIKSINHVIPKDKPILLYKGHDWATSQGLSFYADRYLDKQIKSVEELLDERRKRNGELYCIASSDDFPQAERFQVKDRIRYIAQTGPYGKSRVRYFVFEILQTGGANNL
jgi:4-amino-4-deoxy-L-arabinose transferase-like glycosyltransferase